VIDTTITAGQLRAMGTHVDASVPDCAMLSCDHVSIGPASLDGNGVMHVSQIYHPPIRWRWVEAKLEEVP
jgi:hypothetical protein